MTRNEMMAEIAEIAYADLMREMRVIRLYTRGNDTGPIEYLAISFSIDTYERAGRLLARWPVGVGQLEKALSYVMARNKAEWSDEHLRQIELETVDMFGWRNEE